MMKIVQENTSKEDSENSFVDVFLSTISYKGKYNLFEKMNLKINCVNVNNGDILKSFEYTIKPENFSKEFNVFQGYIVCLNVEYSCKSCSVDCVSFSINCEVVFADCDSIFKFLIDICICIIIC